MKHNAFTALSLAAALVVAGSAGATGFSVGFEEQDYALNEAHAWGKTAEDASSIVSTNNTLDANSTKALLLDTGDAELSYTNDYSGVSVLTMDVIFVAADEAPATNGFTGKTMVYLHDTGSSSYVLKAYTPGSPDWVSLNQNNVTVAPDTWYKLKMEFSGTTVTYSINGTQAGTATLASSFDSVQSVGFKGTGLVDNFVGEAAPVAGPEAWTFDGANSNKVEGVTVASGVVTTTFTDTNLKFIRYFNGESYVTLRYTNSQSEINVGFDPTKIVAFYGNSVTATTGVTPTASAVAVDTTEQKPQIKITVPNAESGLYYTPFGPDGKALADSVVILPEDHGDPATLSVPAVTGDWGVVKFQIVASDEEYEAGENLQPNN